MCVGGASVCVGGEQGGAIVCVEYMCGSPRYNVNAISSHTTILLP